MVGIINVTIQDRSLLLGSRLLSKPILEGCVWSHQRKSALISPHQFALTGWCLAGELFSLLSLNMLTSPTHNKFYKSEFLTSHFSFLGQVRGHACTPWEKNTRERGRKAPCDLRSLACSYIMQDFSKDSLLDVLLPFITKFCKNTALLRD